MAASLDHDAGDRVMARGYVYGALLAALWSVDVASVRAQDTPPTLEQQPLQAAACGADGRSLTDASGAQSDCAPYRCVAGACLAACVTRADCLQGYACGSGACVLPAQYASASSPPAAQPSSPLIDDGHNFAVVGLSAGLNFDLTLPQGELGENIGGVGAGGSLWGAWAPSGWPVKLGLALNFVGYGTDSRTEPLSATLPDVRVDVETTNAILGVHPFVRVMPLDDVLRPYVDAWIGFKHFSTDTNITLRHSFDPDMNLASINNHSDTAFSYGGAIGLQLAVGGRPSHGSGAFLLDAGVRYLAGGEAEYLREGSVRRVGGALRYDVLKSTTDILVIYLGIGFTGS